MSLNIFTPRKALNLSFLKLKPLRDEIESFKTHLTHLLDQIDEKESEEFHKNIISKFLYATYYTPNFYINTKGRNDLVIHNGKDAKNSVGVIIEAKKPSNKGEMLRVDNINTKAFHELVLYYLRERITGRNLEIKHLVVTDIYEWFIFDVNLFEKAFVQDKSFVTQFIDFEEKRLAGKNTDFFYKEIAEPAVENMLLGNTNAGNEISFTYFNIKDYESILRNADKKDDNKLIALFKLLSPEHLLKLPFKNDSNSLDKEFYTELLHIIGLAEVKSGSKKLIDRKEDGKRDQGSLIENAISQLDALDKMSRLENPYLFGATNNERLLNVGIELVITWINRILFLKLLEAQLITYHKGDKSHAFLNTGRIKDFDELNSLFFKVLARQKDERTQAIKQAFDKVPYLNSSLFEPTEVEHACLFISQLEDHQHIPILTSSVLKDNKGKRRTGTLSTLEYLFDFLSAYDFSSEGLEEIQENNKTLINAAVLGLVFEKINGYKDGSFFTPGFITMYMCRETIRHAVVQKFNDVKGWDCISINQLYDKIQDKKEANNIINSIKICDPAVGSGHFLVSALNEIISIKFDLKILLDRQGKTLRDYEVEASNDEIVITDEDGNLYEYNPKNKESQRIQEALFHEKQTIIENCLFGVDINPNSVKICRLRLWIELLKNAYYKAGSNFAELETLPNIDINIKCGNSLISRFPIDANLKDALRKSKLTIKGYKQAVQSYRHAVSKEQKREMEQFISVIKTNFRTEISNNDPKFKKFSLKKGELENLLNQHQLFELTKAEQRIQKLRKDKLQEEVNDLTKMIEEIKTNKIFENAFEWRFEFPEVLNDEGDFKGFDVILGNPPYIPLEAFDENERAFFRTKYSQFERKYETSVLFIIEGFSLLNEKGFLSYIAPATWQTGENYAKFRKHLIEERGISKIVNLPFDTFEDAYVDTSIYLLRKQTGSRYSIFNFDKKEKVKALSNLDYSDVDLSEITTTDYKIILNRDVNSLILKYTNERFLPLGAITKSTQGLSGSMFDEVTSSLNADHHYPFLAKGNVYNYSLVKEKILLTDMSIKKSLKQFYEAEPKILIRRIINRQDRLSVGYTEEKLVFKKDINPFIVTDARFETKFVLAVLASKLISYLYLNMSSIAKKDDFRQTTLAELRKLPIPLATRDAQTPIINLVDQILQTNLANPQADTTSIEREIDAMVDNLYNIGTEDPLMMQAGSE